MRGFWIIMTGLLLLIAASRITRLNDHIMNRDEIWSVWQTFGTPEQIILWTPYDWPPLYYLTLGAWRSFAGILPLALRALSALMFPLGAAFMYRVMRRWQGRQVGMIAALAYSALGFSIQLSMEVRGYALLLALMPLALWLMLRYFDHPGWKRALPLALALTAMFYTSLTSIGAFAIFGLLSLIVYGRAIWRWWLPGIIAAGLAAPEIISKAQYATSRTAATQTLTVPPLPQALLQLFQDYTGFTFAVWAVLLVAAIVFGLYRGRQQKHIVALLVWVLAIPVALYILNPVLGFFSARYAWVILPGIALLIGWGSAYLPRIGRALTGLTLAVMLFVPLPRDGQYQIWDVLSPLGENFVWLRENMQWGDVILDNPRHQCGAPEEWDYYLRAYFPNGVRFTNTPVGQRRLWVLNPSELPDEVREDLNDHYLRGRFVGPPGCLFRLYEAPPDRQGLLFENGMRFHGADVLREGNLATGPLVWHEGETVRLRIWWSVDHQPELDYSVGTSLGRGHNVYDQLDGPPQVLGSTNAPPETSRWLPGLYYVEERELQLPFPASGVYTIDMVVYFWADAKPIAAPGVDENGHLPLLRVEVRSY
jgi:hypothetical protein